MEEYICAHCGEEITDSYYTIKDNFLQVEYFDETDGSDNVFCTKNCLCDSLMVELILIDEENQYEEEGNESE